MRLLNFFLVNFCFASLNLHNFANYFQSVSGEVGFIGIDSYVEPVVTFTDQEGFDFLLYDNIRNTFDNLESPQEFSAWLEEQKFDELDFSNCGNNFDLLTCFHLDELRSASKKILEKNSFMSVSEFVENLR
jgi:hypothetical protein